MRGKPLLSGLKGMENGERLEVSPSYSFIYIYPRDKCPPRASVGGWPRLAMPLYEPFSALNKAFPQLLLPNSGTEATSGFLFFHERRKEARDL